MKTAVRSTVLILLVGLASLANAQRPEHVESPPEGISPHVFAEEYRGCLGPLRSALAREVGFTADFNPGRHQGTVGEEEFLKAMAELGIETDEDLQAFCREFE